MFSVKCPYSLNEWILRDHEYYIYITINVSINEENTQNDIYSSEYLSWELILVSKKKIFSTELKYLIEKDIDQKEN